MSHWLHMEQGGAAGGAGGGAHAGGGPLRVLRRGLHRRKAPARPRPRVVPGMPHPVSPVAGDISPPASQVGTCAQLQANLSNASSDENTRGDAPVLQLHLCLRFPVSGMHLHTGARSRPARARRGHLPGIVCGGRHGSRRVWGRALRAGMPSPPYRFCSYGFICRGRIKCSKQCIETRFKQNN